VPATGITDLESLYARFHARATAVSAEVHRFASRAAAVAFVGETLAKEGVEDRPGSWAVWAGGEEAERSCEVTRERAAAAKVGITEVECAVAATGTLLGDSTDVQSRLASTLPAIHIALVPLDGLRETLADALAGYDPRRARYLAAITGPSRTADIERVLTIGVHGPVRLIIVFYGREEAAA
jgi:L-lactate dehydrogenase complex protein LldG